MNRKVRAVRQQCQPTFRLITKAISNNKLFFLFSHQQQVRSRVLCAPPQCREERVTGWPREMWKAWDCNCWFYWYLQDIKCPTTHKFFFNLRAVGLTGGRTLIPLSQCFCWQGAVGLWKRKSQVMRGFNLCMAVKWCGAFLCTIVVQRHAPHRGATAEIEFGEIFCSSKMTLLEHKNLSLEQATGEKNCILNQPT